MIEYLDKILSKDENEFYEYISKLWAMIIWGNKHYIVEKYIEDNGFDNLKKILFIYYMYRFKEDIKAFGPAMNRLINVPNWEFYVIMILMRK